jgi:hypothetical protein
MRNKISKGKAIKRVLLGFIIWIKTKLIVIEDINIIEFARLFIKALLSLFCFVKKVI